MKPYLGWKQIICQHPLALTNIERLFLSHDSLEFKKKKGEEFPG